jgi:hypothetical protein
LFRRSSEVSDIIVEYQARIIDEASNGYDGSDIPKYKWTFSGSLLYSITVITTIGTVKQFFKPKQFAAV